MGSCIQLETSAAEKSAFVPYVQDRKGTNTIGSSEVDRLTGKQVNTIQWVEEKDTVAQLRCLEKIHERNSKAWSTILLPVKNNGSRVSGGIKNACARAGFSRVATRKGDMEVW